MILRFPRILQARGRRCFVIIKVLIVPSSDYLGHPFPQRHNQIFERLNNRKNFEVHAVRFRLFEKPKLKSKLVIHELGGKRIRHVASYYAMNVARHAFQVRRIVREEDIDVVVLSNLAAPFAYMLVNEVSSFHIPIIFDLPDYYPTSATGYMFDVRNVAGKLLTGMFDFILRYMIRHSTVVTVVSPALREYAKRVGAHKVVYIPNGIGECFLELHNGKTVREKFGYSKYDLVAGYVGSLEFWLDMRSLINGVALARKKGLPVKLLIIGNKLYTSYSKKMEQWIKRKGIEKHVDISGFVPYEDVPKYIAALNLGIIPFEISDPTAHYSAPNKMWEYLSQKKPVISTPIPEALSNSDCVLTALTPEDYVHKLLLIAKRKTEVLQKVETGYKKALNRTWKNSAEIFASTIYSLLNQA